MSDENAVKQALRAALEWIDAIPADVAASLPAMPGFDRDWADSSLAHSQAGDVTQKPEASEAGHTLTIPTIDPVYAEEHPLLSPIIAKRAKAAGNFSPEFSGQRGQDFDRGLLSAFEAVNATLQRMTSAVTPPHKGQDDE